MPKQFDHMSLSVAEIRAFFTNVSPFQLLYLIIISVLWKLHVKNLKNLLQLNYYLS
jgi:hypothetical protein